VFGLKITFTFPIIFPYFYLLLLLQNQKDDPTCDTEGLIKACLSGDGITSESRYLLILTENYAALGILKQHLLSMEDSIVIFGSSFRNDQEYTQVDFIL
jgi:hypothetical protein